MILSPNNIYYIYNEGNNNQQVFFLREDYLLFMDLYKSLVSPFIETIAWCLQPVCFEFMIQTTDDCIKKTKQGSIFIDPVSNGFRILLSTFAQAMNNKLHRTGSLWKQKTKSELLVKPYPTPGKRSFNLNESKTLFSRIHHRPVEAGLVLKPEDWEFSSYRDFAGTRNGNLVNTKLATQFCGYNPHKFPNPAPLKKTGSQKQTSHTFKNST